MVKNKLFAKSSSSLMQKIVEDTSLTSYSQMVGNGKYLKWKIFDADDIAKSNMHSSPLFEWDHSHILTSFSEEGSVDLRGKIYWRT